MLIASGWFEQPTHPATSPWRFHESLFTRANGGAEMHVYDVNGDGPSSGAEESRVIVLSLELSVAEAGDYEVKASRWRAAMP